mmetsp:Transcript_25828/g.31728  ORF Transcript_25828/g.31728 Transcript_25828/m.31728 type:complete len:307 (-) Transcript_25828:235-1155(-)|eukprot:CAMPEP_0204836912 /NCGR_PEP_ID=MMETSP1346-20131115/26567_1 /ASSEMBLY_ACC=CAM_ASM_000771 /TAXON_ID=215587 /ORGANISM="Aplanochytrium stocchinoi, Strain GSBS06" /LENGTH=306 /DNA_ID=CAMNT_0051972029 /DNA_START=114 /DNA_END=1034 /DNA_ORIENTATION=-
MSSSAYLRAKSIRKHLLQSTSLRVGVSKSTVTASETCMSSSNDENEVWTLHEIVIGDGGDAWMKAGFYVDREVDGLEQPKKYANPSYSTTDRKRSDAGVVRLSNLIIRLSGTGESKIKLVFGKKDAGSVIKDSVCDVELETVNTTSLPGGNIPRHPNTCIEMAEVVLYTQDLKSFVKAMGEHGIVSKHPPKDMGSDHSIVPFYFGGLYGSQRTRLLVLGPNDPSSSICLSSPPSNWMFSTGLAGPSEITGWLPVSRDLATLKNLVPTGKIKDAVQRGRKITTLKRGTIPKLTGTFAFLSDGEGSAI